MVEPFDVNPITKLWVKITNNSLLYQHLSEYMKLAKIIVVYVHGLMEDHCIFFILAFKKDKWCNQLGPHLNMIVRMFVQKFFTQELDLGYYTVIAQLLFHLGMVASSPFLFPCPHP